jgi:hypothetical protein
MDLKSKILFSIVAFLVIISVATSYYRFIVTNEYERYYDDYGESEAIDEEASTDI